MTNLHETKALGQHDVWVGEEGLVLPLFNGHAG